MKIADILQVLEEFAPPALQESYDNAGLITGNLAMDCTGVLCTLDCTEAVVDEAIQKGVNLIVAHHPIVFKGLKQITGKNYVERTIIKAIKNDIAIYAIHTNLDHVWGGVNGMFAKKLGARPTQILSPKSNSLSKLYTYVPHEHLSKVQQALFQAGAGQIGNYSECSFNTSGVGTFKALEGADPFVGERGKRHQEPETKLELIFPSELFGKMIQALKNSHPYEEVAYEVIQLENTHPRVGAGMIAELEQPVEAEEFIKMVKTNMKVPCIKHTGIPTKAIRKIAICGGAGSFLISSALRNKVDVYITADLKYHEFFDAEDRIWLMDIGHFESEQYTIDLLFEILHKKFPTFALLKSQVLTNPVKYYI